MNQGLLPYKTLQLFPGNKADGNFTENLLQYIWQFQYYNSNGLLTTKGETIQIVHPGKLNKDQGPDFSGAQVRIDGILLAGSIELHLKSHQWKEHGHDMDPNYNNVILHVVLEHDGEDVSNLPVLELGSRIPGTLLERYQSLMHAGSFIPCSTNIITVKQIIFTSWKERLLIERLTRKSDLIFQYLEQNRFHWEETFWWMLARNFGITVNMEPFEAIARSLPLTIITRHKNRIQQLEALLLGQANLLNHHFHEDYPLLLQREYQFLKKKYDLKPILQPVHFLRMRPGNFPTVRLAQLAALLQHFNTLFPLLLKADKALEVRAVLSGTANDYWHYHYLLDEASAYRPKIIGKEMVNNLIVNTAIPFLFAYGLHHKDDRLKTKAVTWLLEAPAEQNSVTNGFTKLGISNGSGFDSQALLELKTHYCDSRRCLECAVGNALLKV